MRILLLTILMSTMVIAAVNIGKHVASFDLPTVEGKRYHYNEHKLKGRVVVINFWASWCQSCKKEMPLLEKMARKYPSNSFKVLCINLDRKIEMAHAFVTRFKMDMGDHLESVMLHDPRKELFKAHPARGYPYSLIVKDGIIVADHLGALDEKSVKAFEAEIEKALKTL